MLSLSSFLEVPKETEETKSSYRQWKVDELIDNDNDKKVYEHQCGTMKHEAFEKFLAQRRTAVSSSLIPFQKKNSLQEQEMDNVEDDNDVQKINKNHFEQIRSNFFNRYTQRPISTLSSSTLSRKAYSSGTQTIIDLTKDADDNDDDDFIQSTHSFYQSTKKIKST